VGKNTLDIGWEENIGEMGEEHTGRFEHQLAIMRNDAGELMKATSWLDSTCNENWR